MWSELSGAAIRKPSSPSRRRMNRRSCRNHSELLTMILRRRASADRLARAALLSRRAEPSVVLAIARRRRFRPRVRRRSAGPLACACSDRIIGFPAGARHSAGFEAQTADSSRTQARSGPRNLGTLCGPTEALGRCAGEHDAQVADERIVRASLPAHRTRRVRSGRQRHDARAPVARAESVERAGSRDRRVGSAGARRVPFRALVHRAVAKLGCARHGQQTGGNPTKEGKSTPGALTKGTRHRRDKGADLEHQAPTGGIASEGPRGRVWWKS
jgi:hypothetical protein